jgi:hypothetical protein
MIPVHVPASMAEPAEPPEPAQPANPGAMADAQQHARQEIAALEASVGRRARHLVRWLAVPAGVLAGWLTARRRPGG